MTRSEDNPSAPDRAVRGRDSRRGAGRAAVVLVVLAGALALWGCNEQKHYRLLSFFFDGVPLPEDQRLAEAQNDGQGAQATGQKAEVVWHYHRPYETQECYGCHDSRRGFEVPSNLSRACSKCHDSYFVIEPGDWVHGPVAMGMCRYCHLPHKSENEGLLTAAQPDLCFQCHDSSFFKSDAFHSQLDDLTCARCHDPHAAGNRHLLADSRTFQRSSRVKSPSEHPQWKREDCSRCHVEEQSNALRANIDQQCLVCHEALTKPEPGVALHDPVLQGKCTACHTPHKSTQPHLIRPLAEKICFQCHTQEQISGPRHPTVYRANCLACHAGHQSDRPQLLRPGISLAGSVVRNETAPEPDDIQSEPLLAGRVEGGRP